MADACLLVGFALAVGGIGLLSIPAALIAAGVVLFLAGGAMKAGRRA